MPDNIERALREAFRGRAATITVDRLHHSEPRPKRSRVVQRSIIGAAGLVSIAASVIAGGYLLHSRTSPVPSSPTVAPAYVGSRWELLSVRHGGDDVPVPASYAATIEFAPGGTILMSDSVNSLSGRYMTTPTGFTTSGMVTTDVGYVGTDPTKKLVIAAVDALAIGPVVNGTVAPSSTADARVVAAQLVITVREYQLTFERVGPASEPTQPAPTASASGNPAVYAAAIAEVKAYLDLWVSNGSDAAAAAYLVPEEQVAPGPNSSSPLPAPVLLSGSVESYQPYAWASADNFTLEVTMKLHFGRDAGAWGEGSNTRFFTFTRANAKTAYRMYEATGP